MPRRRNLPPPGATPKWCPECETEVPADGWYWTKGKRGACRACMALWHRNRYGTRETVVACGWCGKSKPTTRADTEYCSRACKQDARNARVRKERAESKPRRKCATCGDPVPAEARVDAQYCSDLCRRRARGGSSKARRRIEARGSSGEIVKLRRIDIYERDGWRCQLCGKPIDSALDYPDPRCATLDHIVPLSRGGSHQVDNLQAAHLSCNSSRQDTPLTDPAPAKLIDGTGYLTIPEAAERLGVSRHTLMRLAEQGRIEYQQERPGATRYLRTAYVDQLTLDYLRSLDGRRALRARP